MSDQRSGPSVTVKRSCWGCKHCHTESYCVEDGNDCDSGHYVSCAHPHLGKLTRIGDTSWNTPDWCPVAPIENNP